MSLCADNQTLTDIKDKQKELNNILEAGKEQLAAMQSKMNELKGKLESFKPEIPEIDGIQKDLLSLTSITTPEQLTSKLTELNNKYGTNFPADKISELGLDSFPPTINKSAICDQIPNLEIKPDGTVKEEPKESKPAEEKPPEPTPEKKTAPVAPVELDKYELNKDFITISLKSAIYRMQVEVSKTLRGKKNKRNRQKLVNLTLPEAYVEIVEAGGGDIDELKVFDYTLANLRERQAAFKSKHKELSSWDYIKEGQRVKERYDETKSTTETNFRFVDSFTIASTQKVERVRKKLLTENEETS
jgi:hypothetical protein